MRDHRFLISIIYTIKLNGKKINHECGEHGGEVNTIYNIFNLLS